jgi:hypothetical protein
MDWLILLFLVPAIIVPIVLLWGFVGCSSFSEAPSPSLQAPTNLRAKGEGTNLVTLSWQYTAAGPAFKVERVKEGESLPKIQDSLPGSLSFADTQDLTEGTTYFYKVKAVTSATESDLSNESSATTFPAPPSNVVATPQDVNRIDLSWTNNSAKANQFIILDKQSLPLVNVTEPKVPKGSPMPFPFPVLEKSAHEFQVLAFVIGFQENIKQDVRSLPSAPPVPAKSLAVKAVLMDDPLNLRGRCLVQKIPSVQLKNKGTQVKITVRGSTAGGLTINRIYISQPAASPPGNLWDPHTDLTKIVDIDLDGSAAAVVLPAATPAASKTLGPIAYNLDSAKDLLIAFDISNAPGQGDGSSVSLPGAVAYHKAGTEDAAKADREPGYSTAQGQDKLYLVEKIEVS